MQKSDWSNYTQTGDYSFDASKTNYTDWSNITLYRNGVLVWGTEPSGTGLTAKNTGSVTALRSTELTVQPNPAKDYAVLFYTSPVKEKVSIFLYNNTGAKQLQLSKMMQAGVNTVRFDVSRFSAGYYYLSVVPQDGKMVMKKIEVMK